MLYNVMIIIGGLLASFILFAKFPILKRDKAEDKQYKVSVIIPARNEEGNIGKILEDLMGQKDDTYEVIVIDDASDDRTYEIAKSFPVDVIKVKNKPEGWAGKAWACQLGSEKSSGDILLFLDSDVRLGRYAVRSLVGEYKKRRRVIFQGV